MSFAVARPGAGDRDRDGGHVQELRVNLTKKSSGGARLPYCAYLACALDSRLRCKLLTVPLPSTTGRIGGSLEFIAHIYVAAMAPPAPKAAELVAVAAGGSAKDIQKESTSARLLGAGMPLQKDE